MNAYQLGRQGEQRATAYLRALGYRVLACNWRCVYGEVDIVAFAGATLVFVEVKTRRSVTCGPPEEAVTGTKATALLRSAQAYLLEHDLDVDWRVDVIAIEVDKTGNVRRFNHIPDAIRGW